MITEGVASMELSLFRGIKLTLVTLVFNSMFVINKIIKRVTVQFEDENGNRLVIRGCGLDSGSLTSDTEIVRVSHCGSFYLDGRYSSR